MANGGLAARCRREFCPSKGNEGKAFLPERSGGQQMLTEATVVGVISHVTKDRRYN
jgi:hypothetical protein